MAVLLTDPEKMAEIVSIALTLSLAPGITYGAAKYLLVACLSLQAESYGLQVTSESPPMSPHKTDMPLTDI